MIEHATYVLRMRNVLPLLAEIERLDDQALPGRQTATRNEALRQVRATLRRLDARRAPCPSRPSDLRFARRSPLPMKA